MLVNRNLDRGQRRMNCAPIHGNRAGTGSRAVADSYLKKGCHAYCYSINDKKNYTQVIISEKNKLQVVQIGFKLLCL
jgi:hypothetical protein